MVSCSKNEVNIAFNLPQQINNSYRLLWLASSKSQSFYGETVVPVQAGKGAVKIPTRFPTVVFLFNGSDQYPVSFFWAEHGDDISISGDNAEPSSWSISGNKINEELTAWRLKNKDIVSKCRYEPGIANDAIAKYIRSHTDSEVSTLLLLCMFSREENPELFNNLWKEIDQDAKDERLLAAVARGDFLDSELKKATALKNVVLHSSKGYDTLHINKAKASILYFSGFDSEQSSDIDTLKALAKAFPDKSKRVMADIFLEPDSTAWHRLIDRDTLPDVSRCWVPLSYSDPFITGVVVKSPRFFIVADSKGGQVYRGREASKAAEKFRKLMK
ncbi:MAG: hypothetical protein NC097_01740 [Clostridium sp.]|nr:hypothetical protein [Clostridium sp.]